MAPTSKPAACPWAVGCQLSVVARFLCGSPAPACAPPAVWASRKGTEPRVGQEPARVKNTLSRTKQWLAGLLAPFAARHRTGPSQVRDFSCEGLNLDSSLLSFLAHVERR